MESKIFTIGIDFDDTIALKSFPDIDKATVNTHVKIALKCIMETLKEEGWQPNVVLWTCRTDNSKGKYLTDAIEFCKSHGIPIDYVNENPTFQLDMFKDVEIYIPSPKIHLDFLIDDTTGCAVNSFNRIMTDFYTAFDRLKYKLKILD